MLSSRDVEYGCKRGAYAIRLATVRAALAIVERDTQAGEDLVQGYEQTTQVRGLHQVLGRILF